MNPTGGSTYAPGEIDDIAGWLRDGLSATQIADALSRQRRTPVSRNAIIGVVHRNKLLKSIGFERQPSHRLGGGFNHGPPKAPVPAKQHLHAGNRVFDRVVVVRPRPVDDGIAPDVYDAASRHVPLESLKPRECRWPVNNAAQGEQHLFCGQATDDERSYCPHHCRRAVGAGTPHERAAPRVLERLAG
ncbi:MAG: hypothetical protein EOS70_23290 [Mesorhizobium sp.]|uniref:GcrA family cell cycle regulator n=1 Tax=Mesorhizobium sp. TaxID=1871066 RepID=UPI000FE51F46|nr:GcrA family cell cycle regulator [Mesorhizobium sp.]RWC29819.1 MAG: hypothetical protein EOS70_23290 [Mesorhizobium sp.]